MLVAFRFVGMHVARGELYCMRCSDYIYDTDFDQVKMTAKDECTGQVNHNALAAGEKRKRGAFSFVLIPLSEHYR